MSYDYMVLAGTQGLQNHRKKDRLFELAARQRLPVVFFTEGGGGRPGDTDGIGPTGLDCLAFQLFAELSGLVPLVGIASGRCFAGNAALLGCCDVIIATADANIGMGGPAMIEGGGLGVYTPEEVGPMSVQVPNGVVDVAVADEAEAVAVARRYLAYFRERERDDWSCADQEQLRDLIPENRLRAYDVRTVIDGLADTDSTLELRRGFGVGIITTLARVEGRPLGIVANNPNHLGGAIDADGADKAARFLQLCDAFDLPVLFLCDTPGFMVGPAAEATALVRHVSRLFVVGANLTVPFFTIVLRKGYGLGSQAMAGGSFKAPLFTVGWPTSEFGGMGLEGAVRLGFRRELDAVEDPDERQALFDDLVARAYEHGKGLSTATYFEIDDVIDPADSRRWITTALRSAPPPPPRAGQEAPPHRHLVTPAATGWRRRQPSRREHERPRRDAVLAPGIGCHQALVGAPAHPVGHPLGEGVRIGWRPAAVGLEELVRVADRPARHRVTGRGPRAGGSTPCAPGRPRCRRRRGACAPSPGRSSRPCSRWRWPGRPSGRRRRASRGRRDRCSEPSSPTIVLGAQASPWQTTRWSTGGASITRATRLGSTGQVLVLGVPRRRVQVARAGCAPRRPRGARPSDQE